MTCCILFLKNSLTSHNVFSNLLQTAYAGPFEERRRRLPMVPGSGGDSIDGLEGDAVGGGGGGSQGGKLLRLQVIRFDLEEIVFESKLCHRISCLESCNRNTKLRGGGIKKIGARKAKTTVPVIRTINTAFCIRFLAVPGGQNQRLFCRGGAAKESKVFFLFANFPSPQTPHSALGKRNMSFISRGGTEGSTSSNTESAKTFVSRKKVFSRNHIPLCLLLNS